MSTASPPRSPFRLAVVAAWRACSSGLRAAWKAHRPFTLTYRWLDTPDGGTVVSRLLLVLLCGLAVFVGFRLYPQAAPTPTKHPGYVDAVLQSRLLVLAGRMSLLFVAAFAVLSIAARMWNKEWLSKAGPFEVSKAAATAEDEREGLKTKLARAEERIEHLMGMLKLQMQDSDSLRSSLLAFIDDEQGATDGGD